MTHIGYFEDFFLKILHLLKVHLSHLTSELPSEKDLPLKCIVIYLVFNLVFYCTRLNIHKRKNKACRF